VRMSDLRNVWFLLQFCGAVGSYHRASFVDTGRKNQHILSTIVGVGGRHRQAAGGVFLGPPAGGTAWGLRQKHGGTFACGPFFCAVSK